MKANIDKRFSFSPLSTAVCFFNPSVAITVNDGEYIQELLRKAEDDIAQMVSPGTQEEDADENEQVEEEERHQRQRQRGPDLDSSQKQEQPAGPLDLASQRT